ncbi:MAG: cell division protein FtsL [Streptococcus sp.]|nr:cell division protein FtsL [Streptococcus sp.]
MSEKNPRRSEAIATVLQKHIRRFSRVEQAFYSSVIVTLIIIAISIVYLQSNIFQVQQKINIINSQISETQTTLENTKQEVNELSNRDRVTKIAQEAGLSNQQDNIKKVK